MADFTSGGYRMSKVIRITRDMAKDDAKLEAEFDRHTDLKRVTPELIKFCFKMLANISPNKPKKKERQITED